MVINMVNMVMIKCNIEVKLTCRFWWQTDGCLSSVRWPRTHLPKRCRQTWSVGEQVWAQDGGLRTKQLEQVVCWQWPPHSRFSIDTDLQREIFSSLKSFKINQKSKLYVEKLPCWAYFIGIRLAELPCALRSASVGFENLEHCLETQIQNALKMNVPNNKIHCEILFCRSKKKTDNKIDGIPLQYGCSSSGRVVDFITV